MDEWEYNLSYSGKGCILDLHENILYEECRYWIEEKIYHTGLRRFVGNIDKVTPIGEELYLLLSTKKKIMFWRKSSSEIVFVGDLE